MSTVLLSFALLLMLASHVQASAPAGTVELSPVPLDRAQAVPPLAVLGLNSSVLGQGSLAFEGGYDAADWSGVLKAVALNADGTDGDVMWNAGAMLSDAATSPPAGRRILSASADATGKVLAIAFEPEARFDAFESKGLMTPASEHPSDMLAARVNYLRGERAQERDGTMRVRGSLLGAIVDAQAVYVDAPTGTYRDSWPAINGVSATAPESAPSAQTYAAFRAEHADRPPMLYVAANDGMLHAFNAPVPVCRQQSPAGDCLVYDAGANAGRERWAYIPRAVYGNLGRLTSLSGFQFEPSVDATPVVRDVFFSQRGRHEWHTVLAGGLRLGGRGVYALDITHPDAVSENSPENTVLWEFDADAPAGDAMAGGRYDPADLGYTYGQPAVARLADARWALLVPGGYFPDCNQSDRPTPCDTAATPPGYSALFVLDAQTGAVIQELKTPTSMEGVSSYGLATPVLGDYNDDQIDDVAFAGDLAGNLWRFDLSSPRPAEWKVTLAYRPAVQGTQPVTVMPRLFPDPATGRFMVVFGTGKYLGEGDKAVTGMPTQSVYGIRDMVDGNGHAVTVTHDSLQSQALRQETVDGAIVRTLTDRPLSDSAGGWRIDLDVVPGERVVTTPMALFNSNTALVSTLVPAGDAPSGAVLAVNAANGGPGNGLSFGGHVYAGAMVEKPLTAGSLPAASVIGGGKLVLPGVALKGKHSDLALPLSFGSLLWRRRSWSMLTPDN
ncbi:hypothetical protein ISP15_01560 [Dyella jejuensis]|uniref:PilY1 beta-propeller domain-containing protein n=1 Tax=Dyella jejuensis TaxID=1432009 RepID=A0ABW8JD59_9GAMM